MSADYLVSVLLPTRGRPELMLRAVSSIIATATNPERVQILLKIDNDDINTYQKAYAELELITSHYKVIYSPRGLGYANLHTHVNDLSAIADGEYLFLWNDDALLLTSEWDEILEEHRTGLHGNPRAVIQIDCKTLLTENLRSFNSEVFQARTEYVDIPGGPKDGWKFGFPLVHRDIYKAMGHFSLNAHNDTWMHYVAEDAGVERMERRIVAEHNRYDLTLDPLMNDETYQDIWKVGGDGITDGYAETHTLFITPKETELRRQDSIKVKKLIDRVW